MSFNIKQCLKKEKEKKKPMLKTFVKSTKNINYVIEKHMKVQTGDIFLIYSTKITILQSFNLIK